MDCRYVKNKMLCGIIKERINKYIEELNQDKKSEDETYETFYHYPFQICENDVHIIKMRVLIKKGFPCLGDMFTFAIISNEAELDEIIDSLSLEESEFTFISQMIIFEISERTILKTKKLDIYKIRKHKYIDVEQEDNKKK